MRVVVGRGDVEADEVRAHHDADRVRLSLEERDVAGFLASHANCVFQPNGRCFILQKALVDAITTLGYRRGALSPARSLEARQ